MTHGGNKTAVSGKMATLNCHFGLPEKVQQVLWRRRLAGPPVEWQDVVSFVPEGEPETKEEYQDRATVSSSLADSELSLRPVRVEDEGCYSCEFHTYPDGTKSSTVCLTIYSMCIPRTHTQKHTQRHTHASISTQTYSKCMYVTNVIKCTLTLQIVLYSNQTAYTFSFMIYAVAWMADIFPRPLSMSGGRCTNM